MDIHSYGSSWCKCTHSIRAASTSKASKFGVPLATIMRAAGWSNSNTFRTFYNKPIENCEHDFANAVVT